MCPFCENHFIMQEVGQQLVTAPRTQLAPIIRTHVRVIDVRRSKTAALVYTSVVLVGVIFIVLGWASQPPVDLLQYVGLIGISGCAVISIASVPHNKVLRSAAVCLCVAAAAGTIGTWAYCDKRELIRDKGNIRVIETSRRFWNEILYRKVVVYDDNGNWVGNLEGPTSPESGAPHGHWRAVFASSAFQPMDSWYWYGQEVTEGEWQRRVRGG
jgi:hypothetical protein